MSNPPFFLNLPLLVMSEWWLFYAKWAIFHLYYNKNTLDFNKMARMSILYKTNRISWISLVVAHWNKSPRVDMSFHSGHFIPIPSHTSLCSYNFMPCA